MSFGLLGLDTGSPSGSPGSTTEAGFDGRARERQRAESRPKAGDGLDSVRDRKTA
jgi:hypothetical protein